jgi:hypothetical protein
MSLLECAHGVVNDLFAESIFKEDPAIHRNRNSNDLGMKTFISYTLLTMSSVGSDDQLEHKQQAMTTLASILFLDHLMRIRSSDRLWYENECDYDELKYLEENGHMAAILRRTAFVDTSDNACFDYDNLFVMATHEHDELTPLNCTTICNASSGGCNTHARFEYINITLSVLNHLKTSAAHLNSKTRNNDIQHQDNKLSVEQLQLQQNTTTINHMNKWYASHNHNFHMMMPKTMPSALQQTWRSHIYDILAKGFVVLLIIVAVVIFKFYKHRIVF